MSKLYEHYKICKKENPNKLILIKSGTFYVMLEDDAKQVNEKLGLKLTNLNESVVKCGFPIASLEKYQKMLNANSFEFVLTKLGDKSEDAGTADIEKSVISSIKKLDLENMSPVSALNLLYKYKEKLINKAGDKIEG